MLIKACLDSFEHICLTHLRMNKEIIGANVCIDLQDDRNYAKVDLGVRCGQSV